VSKYSATTPRPLKKKPKKKIGKVKLSFGIDDEEEEDSSMSPAPTPRSLSKTPDVRTSNEDGESEDAGFPKKKLGPRSGVAFVPKVRTKAALVQEAQKQEQLRKEFVVTRDVVKKTDIIVPFVFYDGTITPGGKVKVKKGDHIWLFLDKARKIGAELGVGGDKASSQWARVSVDDLMLVKGEIIIPHHYEFYYFASNRTQGFNGPLFNYSAERTAGTPTAFDEDDEINLATYDPLARVRKKEAVPSVVPDSELEGYDEDPSPTKLVDRRWYERHKHIYPASVWQEFDPAKDYSTAKRVDGQGNAFFLS